MWLYISFLYLLWLWPNNRFVRIRNLVAHMQCNPFIGNEILPFVLPANLSQTPPSLPPRWSSTWITNYFIHVRTSPCTVVIKSWSLISRATRSEVLPSPKSLLGQIPKCLVGSSNSCDQKKADVLQFPWLSCFLSNHKVPWVCALIPKMRNFGL